MIDIRLPRRGLALASVFAVTLAASGCGGDDSTDGDAAASVANTPAEQQLLDANEKLTEALYAGDAKTYCAGQTAASIRSHANSLNATCAQMVASVARFMKKKKAGVKVSRPKVIAVKVEGNRGTITTRSPIEGTADSFKFVLRDGRWLSDVRAPYNGQPQSASAR